MKFKVITSKKLFLILSIQVFVYVINFCLFWMGFSNITFMFLSVIFDFALIVILVKEATHRGNHFLAFSIYTMSTLFMVTIFSFFYSDVGVYLNDGNLTKDLYSCIYFSVITWTSLGYGDIYPSDSARKWVMVEVFFGYVHMGILVGFILDYISSKQKDGFNKGLDLQKYTLVPLKERSRLTRKNH